MKQTATEWLFNQLWDKPKDKLTWYSLLEQAKEMFEEQIIDAWIATDNELQRMAAEQYYTSTYGSKDITLQNQSESKVITELSDEEIKPKHKVGKFIIEAIKEKIARTSQTEISDEEILKAAKEYDIKSTRWGAKTIFIDAVKWYQEQLKKKL